MNKGLIDVDLLQRLQNHFCDANDIYVACLDREYKIITTANDGGETERFFTERLPKEIKNRLLDSVGMSQVETIVEEPLDIPYMKFCAVITRVSDAVALIWMVAAVIEEQLSPEDEIPSYIHTTSEKRFYRSVSFLEVVSKQILTVMKQERLAEEAKEQAQASEEKYRQQMQRSEAMTSVVPVTLPPRFEAPQFLCPIP